MTAKKSTYIINTTKKRLVVPKKIKNGRKVINWPEYNRALVRRGEIDFWINDKAIKKWTYQGKRSQGSPIIYSDLSIQAALVIRSLFLLDLRSTEGLVKTLTNLMKIDIRVPDFTTICRRQKKLKVSIPARRISTEPLHVVIDSTGLKVYGEGEWKVRRYGFTRHRMWRKLHVVLDPKTGQVLAHKLTTNRVTDADAALPLLDCIDDPITSLTGDGGYDRWKVYNCLKLRRIEPIIPPQKNARIKQNGNCLNAPLARDEAIRSIRTIGRAAWKEQTGYHRRSLAETFMFRYKSRFGDKPLAHSLENQKTEAAINCMLLNQFLDFGRPVSRPLYA
jgi:hypothetical protein